MPSKKPTKKAAPKKAAPKKAAKKPTVKKDGAPMSIGIPGYGRSAA